MARPVNANAEETRRKILVAASELFASSGFDGTSVRQIAQAAGVSLGMIRHYFGSKNGLYEACVASSYQIYSQLGGQIQLGLRAGGMPDEIIARAVRSGFRFAVENKSAARLMLWNMLHSKSWRSDLGDREMLPFIIEAASGVAMALGESPGDAAMRIRSLIFLVTRYATADENELRLMLGSGRPRPDSDTTVVEDVERHLVDVAERLFRATDSP